LCVERIGKARRATVAVKGEIARGEIYKIVEMSERTGRNIIKSLLDEGLLVSESRWHKSPLRLGFPSLFAANLFPRLFPDDIAN
jgi:(2Fe-2S) ferredoxin